MKEDLIFLRIIDSIEYNPLSRSAEFSVLINSLSATQKSSLLHGFSKFLCSEIVRQISESIKTQRFKVHFKPLTPQYIDFKKKNKLEEGFWKSTGFLVNHLSYWKYENEWRIGFQKNVKHGESKIPVVSIAKHLEFGTQKRKKDGTVGGIPARPVFTPVIKNVSKNISFYLHKYLKTVDFSKL